MEECASQAVQKGWQQKVWQGWLGSVRGKGCVGNRLFQAAGERNPAPWENEGQAWQGGQTNVCICLSGIIGVAQPTSGGELTKERDNGRTVCGAVRLSLSLRPRRQRAACRPPAPSPSPASPGTTPPTRQSPGRRSCLRGRCQAVEATRDGDTHANSRPSSRVLQSQPC